MDHPKGELSSNVLFNLTNRIIAYSLPVFYLCFPAIIVPIIVVRIIFSLVIALIRTSIEAGSKDSRWEFESPSNREADYWLLRCSICFDSQQELYLDKCRDQFCRYCFNRYVSEVVKNSWGLNVTKIKCPVCQDPLKESEWSKHVDEKIVELYNTYNQPYRPVTRCCGKCAEPVFVAKVEKNLTSDEKLNYIVELFEDCRALLEASEADRAISQEFLANFEIDYQFFTDDLPSSGKEVYCNTIDKLHGALATSAAAVNKSVLDKISELVSVISLRLIAIELRPEVWRDLQFAHIARFPRVTCLNCRSPSCLKCALPSHHSGLNCLDYMREKLNDGLGTKESLENLKWTLDNSKACPHCKILINRDDGCNRVDCLYCGFRFCWVCLSAWSEKCGFYQCQETPQTPNGSSAITTIPVSDQTELGVPDILSIEARISQRQ